MAGPPARGTAHATAAQRRVEHAARRDSSQMQQEASAAAAAGGAAPAPPAGGLAAAAAAADCCPCTPATGDGGKASSDSAVFLSVVVVHTTRIVPVYTAPWDKEEPYYCSGSGFVVADPRHPETGRLIVTNAHCVDGATEIKVQRYQSEEKVIAKVLKQVIDCDLAVLFVSDESFWAVSDPNVPSTIIPALELGCLPKIQDPVRVVGYPCGGREVSITAGHVSRIETREYVHSGMALLSLQTTALIFDGNSGGPVLNSTNQVVGIAFQSGDRVGEFIPVCVFERFLDIGPNQIIGEIQAVAGSGFTWQRLEGKPMRKVLGLNQMPNQVDQSGIYVCIVACFGGIHGKLQEGDVVVEIEDMSISNVGTIIFEGNRISFMHMITSKAVGDSISVGVVRNRQRIDLSWELRSADTTSLVPTYDRMKILGHDPDYIVIGGLVFVSLSGQVIARIDNSLDDTSYWSLGHYWKYTDKQREDEEVVIISRYLPNDALTGYEAYEVEGQVVASLNGQPISALKQVADIFENCEGETIRIDIRKANFSCTSTVILDRKEIAESEAKLMYIHRIPALARIGGQVIEKKGPEIEGSGSNADGGKAGEGTTGDSTAEITSKVANCSV